MEGEKFNSEKKNADSKVNQNRRGFLRFVGSSIVTGLARDAGGEEVAKIRETLESGVVPDEAGLVKTFEILRGGHSCIERRKHSDSQGVFLWELEFPIAGGTAEFGYMRKGKYEVGGSSSATKMHLYFFDETGYPIGGTDVAEFVDGKWKVDTVTLDKYI